MLSVRTRLCVMMFIEFFIWGAWLPLSFGYLPSLHFSTIQQSVILTGFAEASILAMFLSNQFVDRKFSAEKFLAFSQLVGGIAIIALTWITDFWPFLIVFFIHCVFYVPTISITNSIAFTHLKDPQNDFGRVRMWGTIGWIAASWPLVFILADWARIPQFGSVGFIDWLGAALGTSKEGDALKESTKYIFLVAGIGSLALSAFSIFLPHTPPKPSTDGTKSLAWLEVGSLLKQPFMMVLFIITFIDATLHQCYFTLTGDFLLKKVGIAGNWVMPAMSIGQFAEIGTMAVLAYVLKALGWRITMVLGVLGHALRFFTFAMLPEPWAALSVNVLHGVCYAFFFATVYIFVDEFFPKDSRASAQGLFNLMILGLGPAAGLILAPQFRDHVFVDGSETDYKSLFLVLSFVALVAAVILAVFFRPPEKAANLTPIPETALADVPL
jgi:nucleoside transporter